MPRAWSRILESVKVHAMFFCVLAHRLGQPHDRKATPRAQPCDTSVGIEQLIDPQPIPIGLADGWIWINLNCGSTCSDNEQDTSLSRLLICFH